MAELNLTWMIETIDEETDKVIRSALTSAARMNVKKIRNTRSMIIKNWFYPFSGYDFSANSNNFVKYNFHVENLSGVLMFSSWTESSSLPIYESAERWRSKWDGDKPSNEYVADLIFDEGIIGLPPVSQIPGYSGPGWYMGLNLNYHGKEPLSTFIQNNVEWTIIEKSIYDYIYSKIL